MIIPLLYSTSFILSLSNTGNLTLLDNAIKIVAFLVFVCQEITGE